jgi:hypothetical protein
LNNLAGKTSKTLEKPQETLGNLSSISPHMYIYAKEWQLKKQRQRKMNAQVDWLRKD